MQIQIESYLIDVVIEYKNNKNVYLRVKDDLKIHVACNRLVTKKQIRHLIEDNYKTILRMYEVAKKKCEYNNEFYYLGDKYIIVFDDQVKKVEFRNDMVLSKNKAMLDKFCKLECIRIFSSRVEQIKNEFTDIPNFQLKIRFMKTRWGVCNRGNNTVTLNSELLKKDISLLDYVIIHELCHFKHPNHSKNFWDEVSKYYPYYKLARKRLREV